MLGITPQHTARVLGYIDAGKAAGARVVTGGGRPADRDQGVEQSERDAVQRELQEIGAGDGHRHPGSANPGPAMVGGVRWFPIFVDT